MIDFTDAIANVSEDLERGCKIITIASENGAGCIGSQPAPLFTAFSLIDPVSLLHATSWMESVTDTNL